MIESNQSRWSSFTSDNPRGMKLVVVHDCDWFDQIRPEMDRWFDKNCPLYKPAPQDTIIQFPTQLLLSMWQNAWG
jgi:hypothetical protein